MVFVGGLTNSCPPRRSCPRKKRMIGLGPLQGAGGGAEFLLYHMRPIFISGIGTGVGKTLVSAVLAEAFQADYWKPIQAGIDNGTDTEWIRTAISNPKTVIYPERYRFAMAASPHIAARQEGIEISLDALQAAFEDICRQKRERIRQEGLPIGQGGISQTADSSDLCQELVIIEGAGGLLVPINRDQTVLDLIRQLDAQVVLVSRNYLGSINHSLLTARICQAAGISVLGWVFNDHYLDYESEIASWTGLPILASLPYCWQPDRSFVSDQARIHGPALNRGMLTGTPAGRIDIP